MKKLLQWIYGISFVKFTITYIFMMISVLVLSIAAFYFPIHQIYSMLGKEFSNLGPIVTFLWGLLVDLFLITPLFAILLALKLIHKNVNDKRP